MFQCLMQHFRIIDELEKYRDHVTSGTWKRIRATKNICWGQRIECGEVINTHIHKLYIVYKCCLHRCINVGCRYTCMN